MREEGYIDEVSIIRSSTFLALDAPVDSTVLYVEDSSDFDDEGGTLMLNETPYVYDGIDFQTDAIFLNLPLDVAAFAEDEVVPWPEQIESHAAVMTNDEDEPITAIIHHTLINRLPEGIRDNVREAVAMELVGDTWYVVDILGQAPTRFGVNELDEEFVDTTLTAAQKADEALAEAEAAMGFVLAKNSAYRQPDEPTAASVGRPLNEGDAWFDSDDNDKMYVYDGSAWMPVGSDVSSDLEAALAQAQADATQALVDAQEAFDEAAAKASTGYVDTAKDEAIDAANTAADTLYGPIKTRVENWTVPGQTTINGGQIETNTVKTDQLDALAITSKHTLTGALIQSEATANRGIKFNSGALIAYNTSGVATFSVTASTGSVAMLGELKSGSTISGATITGVLQTTSTANRGVKISNSGLYAYDSGGTATFGIDATSGSVTMKGNLITNSTVDGAIITGGQIQTVNTLYRGIKINSAGMTVYDSEPGSPTLGQAMFTISPNTGDVNMRGNLLSGSNIEGAQITGYMRTQAGYPRVEVVDSINKFGGGTSYGVAEIKFITDSGVANDPPRVYSSAGGTQLKLESGRPSGWSANSSITLNNGYSGNLGSITFGNANVNFGAGIRFTGYNAGQILSGLSFGYESGFSTDGSGRFTITHNLGTAYHTIMLTSQQSGGATRIYKVVARGASSDTIQMDNASGDAVTYSNVSCHWVAMV